MTLPPLLDAGSVAAILVAIDRGAARWTMLRRNRMTESQTPGVDPYRGARAMGITVPEAPATETPAKPDAAGDADYAAYLAWKDAQPKPEPAVTPEEDAPADAPDAPAVPAAGAGLTPLSSKLRDVAGDLIDVIQALEAAAG
jgi:hypothetical protein